MSFTFVSALALVGTSLNVSRSVPQLVKSIRNGFGCLSLITWIISLFEITVWATWAVCAHQLIVGISSFLMWPVSLYFVFRIIAARKQYISATESIESQMMHLTYTPAAGNATLRQAQDHEARAF